MKILICDPISENGIEILKEEKDIKVEVRIGLPEEELVKCVPDYNALIVRSETKVTKKVIEAGRKLKVIGRAGVGVDNIDVQAASKQGIIVMNTPDSNTISTAEHTIALLLSLSRNIPQADISLKNRKWERKKFTGVEVFDKVLGIIGLGRVGGEVAKRALALGMRVIAYDPYITEERAKRLEAELVGLEDLLKCADYITLHVPLTQETSHLLGKKEFDLMKPGVRIINCARGGLIDEVALYEAIKSGRVAGAALDVFEEEPPISSRLLELDSVITTPHLGASTQEAQISVALSIAQQVIDALKGRSVRNAVNIPIVEPEVFKEIEPYLLLAEKIGGLQMQLAEGRLSEVRVEYSGEVLNHNVAPITIALVKGLLEPILGEGVNYVNAPILAKERGIKVIESKRSEVGDFANLITVEVKSDKERRTIAGTIFGKKDPRIVRIDEFHLDAIPSGYMLILSNQDIPGVVGKVGTILGNNNINIAGLQLGRNIPGGMAVSVFNVDSPVPDEVLKELRAFKPILGAKLVKL